MAVRTATQFGLVLGQPIETQITQPYYALARSTVWHAADATAKECS